MYPGDIRACQGHPGPIHLLITDVEMPHMNGQELADRLCEFHPQRRVLFMSGTPYGVLLQQGVLKAELPFLQKPFSAKTLKQKVQEVLKK